MIPMLIPAVRQILFGQSLEKKVQAIVRRNGIAMYVPIPGVTCFQDSACTIPAVVDDPVGGLKDYLGLYPATQATSGYRPILRGKVKNLLKYSNDFSNAIWQLQNGITQSFGFSDPDGGNEATKLTASTGTYRPTIKVNSNNTGIILTIKQIQSIYIKKITASTCQIHWFESGVNTGIVVDLNNGVITGGAFGDALPEKYSIITLSNGWYRVSFSITPSTANSLNIMYDGTPAAGSDLFYIYKAQLEVGSVANPYVPTTSAPASSSYGPYWPDFDGVDDVLSISGLSAFTSAAVIKSVKNTGYSIQTEQDISAGYSFNTKFSNALMLAKSTPSSSELAVIKKYFDKLAGITI